MPMPPRPRPEGGQEETSPTFLNHDNNGGLGGGPANGARQQPPQHKPKPTQDELVIGAWNAEEELAKDNLRQVSYQSQSCRVFIRHTR